MKLNKYNIVLSLLALLIVASCGDFLDETPDSRVNINDVDKVNDLLTNAYPSASYLFTETMTDNVGNPPQNTKSEKTTQLYTWSEVSYEDQDSPSYYWSRAYFAVAQANQALESLKSISDDQKKIEAAKGEALLTRAYAHFMMVNMFAKHYNATTASSDLGIAYVTEPETTLMKSYKRKTVQEVYDLIEKDLLEGLNLVSSDFYEGTGRYHFTRETALAFASRFYLYKADFDNCIKYSEMLLGSGFDSRYVRDFEDVRAGVGPGGIARIFSSTSEKSNLLLIRVNILSQLRYTANYKMTPEILRTIFIAGPSNTTTDQRAAIAYVGNTAQTSVYLPKFEELFRRSSASANTGMPYTIITAFRGEEVLLNKAEALVRKLLVLKEGDESKNIRAKLVEILEPYVRRRFMNIRENKGSILFAIRGYYNKNQAYNPNPAIDSTLFLSNFVLDERRREFVDEGLRWFDIKRLGIEVKHTLVSGEQITLKKHDVRTALQIPRFAISNGVEPNKY